MRVYVLNNLHQDQKTEEIGCVISEYNIQSITRLYVYTDITVTKTPVNILSVIMECKAFG